MVLIVDSLVTNAAGVNDLEGEVVDVVTVVVVILVVTTMLVRALLLMVAAISADLLVILG